MDFSHLLQSIPELDDDDMTEEDIRNLEEVTRFNMEMDAAYLTEMIYFLFIMTYFFIRIRSMVFASIEY